VHEHVQHRQRRVDTQPQFGKQPEAKLLAEFEHQQIGRHVEHVIDRRQPCGLHRRQAQLPLDRLQIGHHQPVAQAAGEADQDRHQAIGHAPPHRVLQLGGRAGQGRILLRRPLRRRDDETRRG